MSLDIELSIRKGGLDVGVFAPANMVTVSEANRLLDDFSAALSTLGQGDATDG